MTWNTIKKWCLHSLTIAWAYALLFIGAVLELIPRVVDIVADPSVAEAVRGSLPQRWVGLYTIGIAIVTYGARMRSLAKAQSDAQAK